MRVSPPPPSDAEGFGVALSLYESGDYAGAHRILARICEVRAAMPFCGDCDHCRVGAALDVIRKRREAKKCH